MRWPLALAIWLGALAARWLLDGIADTGPFLTFLPAIALTTVYCGRRQSMAVVVASAAACGYFWLPAAGLQWSTAISLVLFISLGAFELLLVDSLHLGPGDNSQEKRRLESSLRLHEAMSQEMRHRITNQLHVIAAMLEGSQMKIDTGAKLEDVLEQAIGRISSITYLQRIVDDRTSYQRGLTELLSDVLDHIFYDVDVALQVQVAPITLPDHQVTIVCLIVIEAAMNALNHILRRRRGHMFAVELRETADDRLVLTVWDDGPGFDAGSMLADSDRLGLSIMQGLAEQLDGTLTVEIHGGTTVRVEFAGA